MTTQPIIITGIPRSGASMIAGAVALCGGFGGQVNVMNENLLLRNTCATILWGMNVDVRGQYPLPDVTALPDYDVQSVIHTALMNEGYESGEWFLKESRIALTWPIWHKAFPNAKWVVVRRSSDDVLNGCMKTSTFSVFDSKNNLRMVGADTKEQGWMWWINQYQDRLKEIAASVSRLSVVWPERMVHNDYTEFRQTIEWLGLEWNEAVVEYMNVKLLTSKKKKGLI
jgi:hypothetical protein